MKLDVIRFKGEPVGLLIEAESEEDRNLLWALRNLPAKASETFGQENPRTLTLCPQLPWRNVNPEDQGTM